MKPTTETISISKFKATCLAVLERVRRTGKPIVVTKYGEPVAEVVPPTIERRESDWLGAMRGRGRVVGDIITPAADPEEWEVLRD
ncbi:MAG: type II toxin-antitoxin system Phd/YefM family antitoxin [Gemmatimonadota bacterium]